MSERIDCDIAVIGAGSGGLSVAAGAAMLGVRTVLVERGRMGGDCLNYGCVPSKAMISAARHAASWQQAAKLGIQRSEEHTSELQLLMRISYAVFCLKKKKKRIPKSNNITNYLNKTKTTILTISSHYKFTHTKFTIQLNTIYILRPLI